MIKPFVVLPDGKIREKSQEVAAFDESLRKLIADLIDTAIAQTDPPALGLAAPQINVFKRVFIARIRNKFKPFVNPRITKYSKVQTALLEGCFSISGIYGQVTRPAEITVEAQDKRGKRMVSTYKGVAAKIIQHELDHLKGILFIDHVHEQNGKLFRIEKGQDGKEQMVEEEYA